MRHYTIEDYLGHRFAGHVPELACSAGSRASYRAWRRRFVPRFRRALGRRPPAVPLNAEKLLEADVPGAPPLRAEKIVFDSSPGMSVPAWVLLPPDRAPGEQRPAVCLIPGHSGDEQKPHGRIVDASSGKAWGVGLGPDGTPCDTRYHRDVGQTLARAGFIVYCPDMLGFGERAASPQYMRNLWNHCCNLVGQAFVLFDEVDLTGVHFHDIERGLDYLAARPDVDAGRIGMVGCSLGGMWTNNVAAVDQRVRVAASCCSYPNLACRTLGEKLGLCAAQTVPGFARWADLAAPMAAIAPRPLLMQMGRHDPGMSAEDAAAPCMKVRSVYEMLGHAERCAVEVFEGGHEIDCPSVVAWFRRWLGG